MDEIKELLKGLTSVVSAKLDDHDVLIELRTLQRTTAEQVGHLVQGLNETVKDHERRIRVLERIMYYGMGAAAIGYSVFKFLTEGMKR